MPKTGDLISVIVDHEFAYIAHYLGVLADNGPIIQLYRCAKEWQPESGLANCAPLFAPLLVGIGAAVRSGRWRIIGRAPVQPYRAPQFLMQGASNVWFLFENGRERRLGSQVGEELRDLETLSVWSAELLEQRIVSGVNPFSYDARSSWRD